MHFDEISEHRYGMTSLISPGLICGSCGGGGWSVHVCFGLLERAMMAEELINFEDGACFWQIILQTNKMKTDNVA